MRKKSTYIVINSTLIPQLKKISAFKLNLGMSLISRNMHQFMPEDVNIQKHYLFFGTIINMCGYIGSLPVYTNTTQKIDNIMLYNEKDSLTHLIDNNIDMYSNLNNGLNIFFEQIGLNVKSTTITKKEETITIPEYVKPNKPLNEMNMEERMAYLRSQK